MDLLVSGLCIALDIVFWGIIVWIVLSYVVSFGRLSFDHPVRRFYDWLSRFIEPVLRPFRNLLPPVRIGGAALDLSPLILIIGLQVARWVICRG
jgi:YggT family protein